MPVERRNSPTLGESCGVDRPQLKSQVNEKHMTQRKRTGTPVIFRKFRDGEIIALFPAIAGTRDVNTCQCYMHIGQHGQASVSLSDRTTLATPTEYADLLRELELVIGYDDLRVITRPSMWHRRERQAQIWRYRDPSIWANRQEVTA